MRCFKTISKKLQQFLSLFIVTTILKLGTNYLRQQSIVNVTYQLKFKHLRELGMDAIFN